MKNLILVTSPPASGKTYISKMLSKNLNHVVYLDKDTLIPLSNVAFKIAGEEINRSSDFFEEHIRNVEYEVILNIAFEALVYADTVLINAPFTREIRDMDYMIKLHDLCKKNGATLTVVWVQTSIDVCKQRMIERNSERDAWKIANWDEYIATRDFSIPESFYNKDAVDRMYIFKNSSDEEYNQSMKEIVDILQK